jgi:TfoX/Sxy family transcriptional regulator of competence genes
MAYNQNTANRIAEQLLDQNIAFEEKKMFGGIAFMLNEKMCIGVVKDELMLRILYEKYETVLEQDYAKPMQFTGKAMKGFVFVEPEGFETDQHLAQWVQYGVEFGKFGTVKSKNNKSSSKK